MPSSADRRPLGEYRAKRDFERTPEPTGGAQPLAGDGERRGFVVQLHGARRRHYDFRLELGGVLVSWAMPKGPSLDPTVKSLAVHVEDHPLEYREFEGVIPRPEYGGGDVTVWDRGVWTPSPGTDPGRALESGEIHFDLYGEKLRGRFVLVRTRTERGREQWLMRHKRDEWSVEGWSPDDHPRSVRSGRTNEEVSRDPEARWHSGRPASQAEELLSPGHHGDRPEPSPNAPTPEEMDALGRLGPEGIWTLQGRDVKLTNLDKVLFPARVGETPVTKRDLIAYYAAVATYMLPHLEARPVNLHRFPNGSDRPGFWHKQAPAHAPEWITRWNYGEVPYFVVDSVASLVWMANYGALELHPWTSKVPDVDQPTWALIDIDPGSGTSPGEVLVLARLFRAGLDHLGVDAAAKVTGQRGIHIYVPIRSGYSFQQTSEWVEKLSRAVGATVPDLVSWTWQKSARGGRARLDYTQNAVNKTLVAPYSTRPAAGAPVSAPIAWAELDDDSLASDRWTIRSLPARLAQVGDLWAGLASRPQSLPDL
ncbi:MAG: non-homologous end-joining DNA ligase [Acidobacteriota bacterium]|nr:non-homologous end-joining DNA ligase [Acidobacteriota bacterium]